VSSRSVILLFAITTCAAVSSADVIHLKNGRKIWADHVREEGTHLQYNVGDDSYAIPKALVERVEEGGVPPEVRSSSGVSKEEVPSFVPNDELQTGGDLPAQVLREGHVDNDALASLNVPRSQRLRERLISSPESMNSKPAICRKPVDISIPPCGFNRAAQQS